MADFVTLAGTRIPVRIDPVDADVLRFGDDTEAYDGTPLTRRRARKLRWPRMTTPWLSISDAIILEAILEATPPIAATGDLTGSIDVLVTVVNRHDRTVSGGVRMRAFTFIMREV